MLHRSASWKNPDFGAKALPANASASTGCGRTICSMPVSSTTRHLDATLAPACCRRFHGAVGVHPIGLGFHTRTQRRREMQASNVSTPTTDHISTIFVPIELSQKSWLVIIHSPARDRSPRHNLADVDHADLRALIDRARERAHRALR